MKLYTKLSELETCLLNNKRDKLLSSLAKKVKFSFLKTKSHLGKLSPGCLICGKGTWSCIFINRLCTANCFFCPQERHSKKEGLPKAGGITFDNAQDYIGFLKKLNFKGVGFSGGEPLLIFGKLLSFIKEIRKAFGKKIYIWLYTNGDLVDRAKLEELRDAGLNEIRFNISARNYDLSKVRLAVGIINTVTVEIPAIPEDYNLLRKSLAEMQRLGVSFLNLHQLYVNKFNYKNYIRRKYTLLDQFGDSAPVFESEITAFKLIKYALDNGITMPINYCSLIYKGTFQGLGARMRLVNFVKEDAEEITNAGYIRRLFIRAPLSNLRALVRAFKKKMHQNGIWMLDEKKKELYIHRSLLSHINPDLYAFGLRYFSPKLSEDAKLSGNRKEIKLSPNKKIFVVKKEELEYKEINPSFIKSLQMLFRGNKNFSIFCRDYLKNYSEKGKMSIKKMTKEMDFILSLKDLENL